MDTFLEVCVSAFAGAFMGGMITIVRMQKRQIAELKRELEELKQKLNQ